ncbi:hypothetical protein SAMN05444365_11183 [Micromonospora pattaloongensis]|uniref:Uncharacterized protein n=1 Tax=Micromonospora pattaloongensis TaxID=405436 RepID=A0A1H3SEI2_9ACTN|nr:hypothetical protein [Micromonospora pattaloongensis]SDZ36314.1 hypothetical protein SAMN05444365_11183 [Micromonospora pattaloongensis]
MTGEQAPFDGDENQTRDATRDAEDTAELIARIRALAAHDPAVRQVVTDVLAELDRVTGGAYRDRMPESAPLQRPTIPGQMAPTSSS